jgi:hypothetical protein
MSPPAFSGAERMLEGVRTKMRLAPLNSALTEQRTVPAAGVLGASFNHRPDPTKPLFSLVP